MRWLFFIRLLVYVLAGRVRDVLVGGDVKHGKSPEWRGLMFTVSVRL